MLNQDAFVDWRPRLAHADYQAHPTLACVPANLAAVALSRPLRYAQRAPRHANLSSLQYETVSMACQALDADGAFLLGDSTGMGKGRTIVAVVREHRLRQPTAALRAVWVSANARLRADAEREFGALDEAMDATTLFTSYAALSYRAGSANARAWLEDGDTRLLILDESHTLRNESKASRVVETLLAELADVRVLFSSATAASSAKHLHYMGPLGLWGAPPFATESALMDALRRYGSPMMELLALDMAARGVFVTRQLSFADVRVDRHRVALTPHDVRVYDACVRLLRRAGLSGSRQQRFFHRLITALKTRAAIAVARRAVADGCSVVVSLLNTGEADAAALRRSGAAATTRLCDDAIDALEDVAFDKALLPKNPVDQILEAFGHERVAELTGRSMRVEGAEWRPKPKLADEARAFQAGEKHVAVLSRAGGVGISLNDEHEGDRPRVHVVLELPWSAEDFFQQIGRTHRASSRTAPRYVIVTSDVPGETRFSNAIVHKLAGMGALIKGDADSCHVRALPLCRLNAASKRSIALFVALARLISPSGARPRRFTMAQTAAYRYLNANVAKAKHELIARLDAIGRRTVVAPADASDGPDADDDEAVADAPGVGEPDVGHGDDEERCRLVGCAAHLFPGDAAPVLHRWSPATHVYFSSAVKQRVFTVLLCSRRPETRRTLGLLPDVLLEHVIEGAVTLGAPLALRRAAHEFGRVFPRLDTLHETDTNTVLNRLMSMTLASQRVVYEFMASVVPPEAAETRTLHAYAQQRAGAGVSVRVSALESSAWRHGLVVASAVVARVEYGVRLPRAAPRATFWLHPTSRRVGFLAAQEFVFVDGTRLLIDGLAAADELEHRGFRQCERREWDDAVAAFERRTARRIGKLDRRMILATSHMPLLWEQSAKRVLRADCDGETVVGLLMRCARQ